MLTNKTTLEELAMLHRKYGVTRVTHHRVGGTHVVMLIALPAPGCMRQKAQGVGTSMESMVAAMDTALYALDCDLAEQAHYAETLASLEAAE